MSGRHSGRLAKAGHFGVAEHPETCSRLAPRQLNDEISLAKLELKGKANSWALPALSLALR
ncbi:hypothetical protein GCM10017710_49170 [Arthrobacter ramosus]|uniref:hypothetical protein n=1 Tax=Arthrobacter ramosus TaxID=1672 RepID=UPI002FE8029D